jgi:hypothetical protein
MLNSELELAKQRYERAQVEFSAAIALPSAQPDRSAHIKRAAETEVIALKEYWLAQQRLVRFHERGVVPGTSTQGVQVQARLADWKDSAAVVPELRQ